MESGDYKRKHHRKDGNNEEDQKKGNEKKRHHKHRDKEEQRIEKTSTCSCDKKHKKHEGEQHRKHNKDQNRHHKHRSNEVDRKEKGNGEKCTKERKTDKQRAYKESKGNLSVDRQPAEKCLENRNMTYKKLFTQSIENIYRVPTKQSLLRKYKTFHLGQNSRHKPRSSETKNWKEEAPKKVKHRARSEKPSNEKNRVSQIWYCQIDTNSPFRRSKKTTLRPETVPKKIERNLSSVRTKERAKSTPENAKGDIEYLCRPELRKSKIHYIKDLKQDEYMGKRIEEECSKKIENNFKSYFVKIEKLIDQKLNAYLHLKNSKLRETIEDNLKYIERERNRHRHVSANRERQSKSRRKRIVASSSHEETSEKRKRSRSKHKRSRSKLTSKSNQHIPGNVPTERNSKEPRQPGVLRDARISKKKSHHNSASPTTFRETRKSQERSASIKREQPLYEKREKTENNYKELHFEKGYLRGDIRTFEDQVKKKHKTKTQTVEELPLNRLLDEEMKYAHKTRREEIGSFLDQHPTSSKSCNIGSKEHEVPILYQRIPIVRKDEKIRSSRNAKIQHTSPHRDTHLAKHISNKDNVEQLPDSIVYFKPTYSTEHIPTSCVYGKDSSHLDVYSTQVSQRLPQNVASCERYSYQPCKDSKKNNFTVEGIEPAKRLNTSPKASKRKPPQNFECKTVSVITIPSQDQGIKYFPLEGRREDAVENTNKMQRLKLYYQYSLESNQNSGCAFSEERSVVSESLKIFSDYSDQNGTTKVKETFDDSDIRRLRNKQQNEYVPNSNFALKECGEKPSTSKNPRVDCIENLCHSKIANDCKNKVYNACMKQNRNEEVSFGPDNVKETVERSPIYHNRSHNNDNQQDIREAKRYNNTQRKIKKYVKGEINLRSKSDISLPCSRLVENDGQRPKVARDPRETTKKPFKLKENTAAFNIEMLKNTLETQNKIISEPERSQNPNQQILQYLENMYQLYLATLPQNNLITEPLHEHGDVTIFGDQNRARNERSNFHQNSVHNIEAETTHEKKKEIVVDEKNVNEIFLKQGPEFNNKVNCEGPKSKTVDTSYHELYTDFQVVKLDQVTSYHETWENNYSASKILENKSAGITKTDQVTSYHEVHEDVDLRTFRSKHKVMSCHKKELPNKQFTDQNSSYNMIDRAAGKDFKSTEIMSVLDAGNDVDYKCVTTTMAKDFEDLGTKKKIEFEPTKKEIIKIFDSTLHSVDVQTVRSDAAHVSKIQSEGNNTGTLDCKQSNELREYDMKDACKTIRTICDVDVQTLNDASELRYPHFEQTKTQVHSYDRYIEDDNNSDTNFNTQNSPTRSINKNWHVEPTKVQMQTHDRYIENDDNDNNPHIQKSTLRNINTKFYSGQTEVQTQSYDRHIANGNSDTNPELEESRVRNINKNSQIEQTDVQVLSYERYIEKDNIDINPKMNNSPVRNFNKNSHFEQTEVHSYDEDIENRNNATKPSVQKAPTKNIHKSSRIIFSSDKPSKLKTETPQSAKGKDRISTPLIPEVVREKLANNFEDKVKDVNENKVNQQNMEAVATKENLKNRQKTPTKGRQKENPIEKAVSNSRIPKRIRQCSTPTKCPNNLKTDVLSHEFKNPPLKKSQSEVSLRQLTSLKEKGRISSLISLHRYVNDSHFVESSNSYLDSVYLDRSGMNGHNLTSRLLFTKDYRIPQISAYQRRKMYDEGIRSKMKKKIQMQDKKLEQVFEVRYVTVDKDLKNPDTVKPKELKKVSEYVADDNFQQSLYSFIEETVQLLTKKKSENLLNCIQQNVDVDKRTQLIQLLRKLIDSPQCSQLKSKLKEECTCSEVINFFKALNDCLTANSSSEIITDAENEKSGAHFNQQSSSDTSTKLLNSATYTLSKKSLIPDHSSCPTIGNSDSSFNFLYQDDDDENNMQSTVMNPILGFALRSDTNLKKTEATSFVESQHSEESGYISSGRSKYGVSFSNFFKNPAISELLKPHGDALFGKGPISCHKIQTERTHEEKNEVPPNSPMYGSYEEIQNYLLETSSSKLINRNIISKPSLQNICVSSEEAEENGNELTNEMSSKIQTEESLSDKTSSEPGPYDQTVKYSNSSNLQRCGDLYEESLLEVVFCKKSSGNLGIRRSISAVDLPKQCSHTDTHQETLVRRVKSETNFENKTHIFNTVQYMNESGDTVFTQTMQLYTEIIDDSTGDMQILKRLLDSRVYLIATNFNTRCITLVIDAREKTSEESNISCHEKGPFTNNSYEHYNVSSCNSPSDIKKLMTQKFFENLLNVYERETIISSMLFEDKDFIENQLFSSIHGVRAEQPKRRFSRKMRSFLKKFFFTKSKIMDYDTSDSNSEKVFPLDESYQRNFQILADNAIQHFSILVDAATVSSEINNELNVHGFLTLLQKIKNGHFTFLKAEENVNYEEDIRNQAKQAFNNVYLTTCNEARKHHRKLTNNDIHLVGAFVCKYRIGLLSRIDVIASYLGKGFFEIELELKAAVIYIMKVLTSIIELEDFENYCRNSVGVEK